MNNETLKRDASRPALEFMAVFVTHISTSPSQTSIIIKNDSTNSFFHVFNLSSRAESDNFFSLLDPTLRPFIKQWKYSFLFSLSGLLAVKDVNWQTESLFLKFGFRLSFHVLPLMMFPNTHLFGLLTATPSRWSEGICWTFLLIDNASFFFRWDRRVIVITARQSHIVTIIDNGTSETTLTIL